MKEVDKYIVDGKVAVLFSSSYGAGWSTWEPEPELKEKMLFDPEVVQLVLDKNKNKLEKLLRNKYNSTFVIDCIDSILRNLNVMWIKVGTQFKITHLDGKEYIKINPEFYYIA